MSWAEGRTGISSRAISSRVFLLGSVTEINVSDEIQEDPWKRSGLWGSYRKSVVMF